MSNSADTAPIGDPPDKRASDHPDDDYPVLIVLDEKHRPSRQWQIKKDSVIIGRDINCDIITDEYQLSRQHIRIYRLNDDYWLEDLHSKNGTWLNRERVSSPQIIRDGDEIQLALMLYIIFVRSSLTVPLILDVDEGNRSPDQNDDGE